MVVQARRDPDHFDSLAYSYDSVTPRHIAEHYLSRRTTFITKQLPRPARILDIGCGTGRLASRLSIMGFEVTGLDFSAQMLKVARSRNLVGAQGSVDCLPFADETFDASISIAVLHHLREEKLVRKAIQEMVRVTRKGGTIIVWDHNPLNPYWPVIMKKVPQDVGSERLVPVGEILGGLVDERIKEICLLYTSPSPRDRQKSRMPSSA